MSSKLSFLFVILLSIFSEAQSSSNYPFPAKDPYLATIFAAFSAPKMPTTPMEFPYKPSRQYNPYFPEHQSMTFSIFQTPKPAPLVLIIAGVGGNGGSNTSAALGEFFRQHGIQSITLPNPISWSYALGNSETGAPGYLPRDADEYYKFIQRVLKTARQQEGLRYTSVNIFGYSNGGLLAGFLANKDKQQPVQLFSKIILLNPAVDVKYGIDVLDRLYVDGQKLSDKRRSQLMGAIYTEAPGIAASMNPVEALFGLLKKYKVVTADIKWLIGDSYHSEITNVFFVSQMIQDRGILKEYYSRYRLNARFKEARKFLFNDYLDLVVKPSLSDKEQENMIYKSSLYSQFPELKEDRRVYVFENEDDFILKPGDIELMKDTFQDRLFLFPLGGHMGNVMFPINLQMYLNVLK